MHVVPILIASSLAIFIALGVWGFFGEGIFFGRSDAPLTQLETQREKARDNNGAEKNIEDNEKSRLLKNLPLDRSDLSSKSLAIVSGFKPDHFQFKENPVVGTYVTDMKGRTLYVADRECTGGCLEAWPPYIAEGVFYGNERLGIILRKDLRRAQFTWDGKPLYYYAGDKKASDTNGHRKGGVWFVATK